MRSHAIIDFIFKGSTHNKDKVKVTDGTLKVPKLETRDSGDYTCVQTGKKYTLHVVSGERRQQCEEPRVVFFRYLFIYLFLE